MKTANATLLSSLLLLAATTPVWAQCPPGATYVEPKSATEWESYLRGLGRLFEGGGEGFRDMADGIKTIHEARELQIRNNVAALSAYFEKKELNQAYRRRQRGPSHPTEFWHRLARIQAPERLSPDELSAEGHVVWPAALLDARYAGHRCALEWLLKARITVAPERQLQMRLAIEQVCGWMLRDLQRQIRVLPTDAYIDATRFTRSLAYEARFHSPVAKSEAYSEAELEAP